MVKRVIIEISWDYTEDIIWISNDNGNKFEENSLLIENDKILNDLQIKINDLYSSFYEFDSHGEQVWWNKKKMKNNKFIMLDLLKQLNDRLNEINDGSFIIKDNLTNYWMNIL